jgi:hypothetical protein
VGFGEVWWFLGEDDAAALAGAVAALRDAGLKAGNPATGVPELIDGDGVRVPWHQADVRQRWLRGDTVTAQLWINQETDVLVELIQPHRLLTFDLDGMTTAEARFTVFAVLNAALSVSGTAGVVVDRNLPDIGDDLLAAVANGALTSGIAPPPDLLARAEREGHHSVVIRRDSWLAAYTD